MWTTGSNVSEAEVCLGAAAVGAVRGALCPKYKEEHGISNIDRVRRNKKTSHNFACLIL
jgi:hypothetical protein